MFDWLNRWQRGPNGGSLSLLGRPSPLPHLLSPGRSGSHRLPGQTPIAPSVRLSAAGSHCPLSGGSTPIARLSSAEEPGSRLRAPIAPYLGVRLPSFGSHRPRVQALGFGLPLPAVWASDSYRPAPSE